MRLVNIFKSIDYQSCKDDHFIIYYMHSNIYPDGNKAYTMFVKVTIKVWSLSYQKKCRNSRVGWRCLHYACAKETKPLKCCITNWCPQLFFTKVDNFRVVAVLSFRRVN